MVIVEDAERSAAIVSTLISNDPQEKVWQINGPHGVVYRRHQYRSREHFTDHSYYPRTPDMDQMDAGLLAATIRERFSSYLPNIDLLAGVAEMQLVRGLGGEPQVHTSRSAVHCGIIIFITAPKPPSVVVVEG